MSLRQFVAALHHRPLPGWAALLLPLVWAYRLVVAGREALYRFGLIKPVHVPVPVISVGNLTTGGTGKTPIVLELARGLVIVGKRVVILSRGYGATQPLAYGRPTGPEHGEEAFLLQQQLPDAIVIVGRNRAQNAIKAVQEYQPDYVLLDDGFQYRRLNRDLDILLVDGDRGFGNGHLLPLGPLREPQEQLCRADMVFITKSVTTEQLQDMEARMAACGKRDAVVMPVSFQVRGIYSPASGETVSPVSLLDKAVVAFSGIAQPDRFEQDLRDAGLQVHRHERFTDHHPYSVRDVKRLYANLPDNPVIVTTDKDWVKVSPLVTPEQLARTYILKVSPALDGEWFYREFLAQIFQKHEVAGSHVASSR